METISNALEDRSISEQEKLEIISQLINTILANQKININTTVNVNLKNVILKKLFIDARSFEDTINYFIEYFEDKSNDAANQELLIGLLIYFFEMIKVIDKIESFLNRLQIKNVNDLLLNRLCLRKYHSNDVRAIFENYLDHLSIINQSIFFNSIFEFSKNQQNIDYLCLVLDCENANASTLESSPLQTMEFWIYLTNLLENCKDAVENEKIVYVLATCRNFFKETKSGHKFLIIDNNEKGWTAFLTLARACIYRKNELLEPALELLQYISSLHFFWQLCILKLLTKHATDDLMCIILIFFLKQPMETYQLQNVFENIFPAINKHKCISKKCQFFKELYTFCKNLDLKDFSVILDELLKVSWSPDVVNEIVMNVLVDSKKNLIDFSYFYKFEILLNALTEDYPNRPLNFLDDAAEAIFKFFGDPENFDNMYQIRKSSIKLYRFHFQNADNLEDVAIKKILELSNRSSDDLKEMKIYFTFIKDNETLVNLIKNHSLSIHVRIVIYKLLFNMSGYWIAREELDQEKTANDFYDYLVNNLNEKTFSDYRRLMSLFLEIMGRFMTFTYPEKFCLEIVSIVKNPQLYTKHQIYCATDILRWGNYRFDICENDYKEIAQKWKQFIFETEDSCICKEGLYYVLTEGKLGINEHNEIVKKLLEKHFCDDVAEEIYENYLNVDMMNFAFKHLNNIKQHNQKIYDKFLPLFWKAIFSDDYVSSGQFDYNNENFRFCFSNSTNLQYAIEELKYNIGWSKYTKYKDYRERIMDFVIRIYFNNLSNIYTQIHSLFVLNKTLDRYSNDRGRPPFPFERFTVDVKFFLNKFKDKYAANTKNDIVKLRIVQALFLPVSLLMRDFTVCKKLTKKLNIHKILRNKLKRIVVGILVKEYKSGNNAVRQICQLIYILLSDYGATTFQEIKCVIEKIMEQAELSLSFMPVLYHIIPFIKFSLDELEQISEYMLFLLQSSHRQLRMYSQILFQRIYNQYNKRQFNKFAEKYKSKFDQIGMDIEDNKKEIEQVLDVDYLFLTELDPKRDNFLLTVLYSLPKLNQVDSSLWKEVDCDSLVEYYYSSNRETFKIFVDQYIIKKENEKKVKYCTEDILAMFKVPSQNPCLW